MKHLLLSFSFLFFYLITNAQAPLIQWQHAYGGSSDDYGIYISNTKDSGYIIGGLTFSGNGDVSGNHGGGDAWIAKLKPDGNISWAKSYGGYSYEQATCIIQINGGYMVLASTYSNNGEVTGNHGGGDIWVLKLDDTGKIIWQKTYGGSSNEFGVTISKTFDNGFIITGSTQSSDGDVTGYKGGTGSDVWVFKIDSTGNLIWQKTYGGTSDDGGASAYQTNDSGYIIGANTQSNDGDVKGYHGGSTYYGDYWVLKLNDTGKIVWAKTYGGSQDESASSLKKTNDGGYIITGFSDSHDGDVAGADPSGDFWTVKLNDTGAILWQNVSGGTYYDNANSVAQTKDSGYIVAGFTYSSDGDVTGYHGLPGADMWVIKLDAYGTLKWETALGGDSSEAALTAVQAPDGGYAIIGKTQSYMDGDVTNNHGMTSGTSDIWVVKLSSGLDVHPLEKNSSANIKVYPTLTSSIVYIDLPEDHKNAEVKLFDIFGRPIQSLTNDIGMNRVINMQGLAAGMYIIQVVNGIDVQSFKVVYRQ